MKQCFKTSEICNKQYIKPLYIYSDFDFKNISVHEYYKIIHNDLQFYVHILSLSFILNRLYFLLYVL